jgi:hypothetical protein
VNAPGTWVLLSYRLPREPSAPRVSLWRKLKRLGVAQIADGLVALPADARSREHFEWLAEEVLEADGSAGVWLAQPSTVAQERELAGGMAVARIAEYEAIRAEADMAAELAPDERTRLLRRLRAELRRVNRRDYFPPAARDTTRAAVEALGKQSVHVAERRS